VQAARLHRICISKAVQASRLHYERARMSMDSSPAGVSPAAVRRKIAWRILPLIFFLYVIAYLDRANVGFAKLRMKESLQWDEDVFGWGFGIFFAGYLILEIPGALLVEHWSARKWFTRILITWGICSMAMAFVATPWQFYVMRFLLGLAEAGFFPGVIVYFTHWFPRADRARALSGLVLGVPVSLALGSRLSGFILQHAWFGIDGWQWVFLLEGAPAVLAGLALPFLLTDRPGQASWLTLAERQYLEQTIERERAEAAQAGSATLAQALRHPSVWILSLGILATNTGGYSMVFWLPSFLESMLKAQDPTATATDALNWIGLIYLCGFAGVVISGRSSDLTGERKWHCIAGQVGAGLFLALSLVPGQPFVLVMLWLGVMGFWGLFWPSPFWVLPTLSLSASAAAVAVGIINISANLAGLIGPAIVGEMRANGYADGTCLIVLSCCYAGGGVIIALLRVTPKKV
jgi:ACS family tartrate transporter-like MFS transporter